MNKNFMEFVSELEFTKNKKCLFDHNSIARSISGTEKFHAFLPVKHVHIVKRASASPDCQMMCVSATRKQHNK